jgi:hypothetical protein
MEITGQDTEFYSDALAVSALDPKLSDVLNKTREDFAVAGVVQSDEQILRVIHESHAASGEPGAHGARAQRRPRGDGSRRKSSRNRIALMRQPPDVNMTAIFSRVGACAICR